MSEEPFRPEDSGKLGSDALNVEQHRRRCWRGGVFRGQQHIPLGLHGFDLLEQQLEPVKLTANLCLQMLRQRTARRRSGALPGARAGRGAAARIRLSLGRKEAP